MPHGREKTLWIALSIFERLYYLDMATPLWLRVRIDGTEHVLRVLAADAADAARHVHRALDGGRRIEHITPFGPLTVEWGRVATLQILGLEDGAVPVGMPPPPLPDTVAPPPDSVMARMRGGRLSRGE